MPGLISVIVPTVDGREEHLARCEAAYRKRTIAPLQLIVVRNEACCGDAWNKGAEQAEGAFLHWTADDLEPRERGWDAFAAGTVAAGKIPAPVIYKPDGSVESVGGYWQRRVGADGEETDNTSVVPFCSRATWELIRPHLSAHYYTDNYFTDRVRALGCPVVIRTGYAFTHHWASEGRGAGAGSESERMAADREVYLAASGGEGLSDLPRSTPGRPVRR